MNPDDKSLHSGLTSADDRVKLSHWLPPRHGIVPEIRIGNNWYSIFWLLPLGALVLIIGILLCLELRRIPVVQDFIARYPGSSSSAELSPSVGFPWWLRWQHYFNLFFLMFIIRSGIQILADHPRLYWNVHCTPGTEWFRFQKEVPKDRIWTAKDDSVTIPGWLGLPGIRHSIGLSRWWHFSFALFWLGNGIIFYLLLFLTPQWKRIVPLSWDVFPNALSVILQYLSLQFPSNEGWTRYNSAQQLAYFLTVFLAAPLAVVTGLLQAPALANRLTRLSRIINRQVARSIHFLVLCWFLIFTVIHVSLVFLTGASANINRMFAGINGESIEGWIVFLGAMLILILAWLGASPFTIKYARLVQKAGRKLLGKFFDYGESLSPQVVYTEKDISPFFWPNGKLPQGIEFERLIAEKFVSYRLSISGLVDHPCEFSMEELRAMPKQEQITNLYCIQGWSGIAKWGGVPMRYVLKVVHPRSDGRYAVFYSFGEGGEGGIYYDVHTLENMQHHLTILAYEMNGSPLSVLHGAPLRLICPNELGFKQVKWIRAIEFVSDFKHLGAGQGGYNEDHEFFGYRAPI
ncbi:oxidoreductase [Candidatus Methylacidiphilum fumarolicum]|nr:molybdopterin-dependent oxidoreductase [Candidatus Methylacidiphilum fumarolicum]MBW6414841.1 molybdopterin-dependent oxidoreductase [Candidatus Methylacidiphilum fumarolicum]TFE68277.1 oxidoreductase [Candidatus Methylacidiphilum fumarolicum]TFE73505.1 oxidoreductase [Candidatus Methylacidiphilum fumarolicum]TFE75058.1 oxidoreductase [Candidatus Methylacidiphilum fumarolicum]TFE76580.1 oxidoreductase [Candidatus Methylacidiphilum fumarolicum]